MHRRLISIIFALVPVFCFSQDFLHSVDYVYGMGRGDSVFAADSAAMLSLSMSLRTHVVNETSHTIRETNKGITSVFEKNVSLDSSIDLSDSQNYVLRDNDGYIVYRYFNKRKYIDTHMSQYLFFMQKANEIKGTNVKHEKNLLLGCYYLAYLALDTPIMDLYGNIEDNKKDIIKMARETYCCNDYGTLAFIAKKWNGYEVSMAGQIDRFGDTEPIELVGFEYFNEFEWANPKCLSSKCNFDENLSNDPNTNVKYRRGVVEVKHPQVFYHILYEKYDGGRYIKIEVPDKWYFSVLQIKNPLFLP